MTKRKRWLSFLSGMFLGALCIAVALIVLVYWGGQKVWLLQINTFEAAEDMEDSIQAMAEDSFPVFIAAIKPRIPGLVAERVNSQFGDLKFHLGGEDFTLPQELLDRMENNYRTSLINSIGELLDSLPLSDLGRDLGIETATLVENAIYAKFDSRTFDIAIASLLSVPVKVELMNQPGIKAFQLQLTAETRP